MRRSPRSRTLLPWVVAGGFLIAAVVATAWLAPIVLPFFGSPSP